MFGKSSESDGTTVETVGSSASYNEMADIEYFLRGFLKMFKVPFSRYKTPENTIEKNDNISYEEYTFSRMIMRLQRRFADGFKKGFITHLKLKDLWDKKNYELSEQDIKVSFSTPVLYDLYEKQKQTEVTFAIYKAYTDNDEMSKSVAMKNVLGWSDEQINENFVGLIKDKQLVAVADYFGEQISEENPPVDYKSPIRLKKDLEKTEKVFAGEDTAAAEEESAEGSSSSEGEEQELSGGDESGEVEDNEEEVSKEAETPTFGLG